MKLSTLIINLLFPPACLVCHDVVTQSEALCEGCIDDMVRNRPQNACPKCGKPVSECICPPDGFSFSRCVGMTAYLPQYSAAAQELKHKPDSPIAGQLAALMADAIFDGDVCFDCITEVPMAESEMAKRGHNQARTLALELCRLFNMPHLDAPLVRLEGSLVQHTLPRNKRFENANRSFIRSKSGSASGRVLLVDDICTTGATLERCAGLLLECGATSVVCATAFTVLKHQ